MPGLVGFVEIGDPRSANNSSSVNLDEMIKPLLHHSWYKVDKLNINGISAACVHTGILHENTLFTSHEGIHVLLHGEIYSDNLSGENQLEYIVTCYREKEKLFAKELNGSFAILLFDEKKKLVLFATDRIGSKPIIYLQWKNRLYFAPELKSLLKIPGLNPHPNLAAIADVITNGYLTGGRTLIENAHFLDYASVLEISTNNSFKINRYWQFTIDEDVEDKGNKYYEDNLAELLHQAVRRRMQSSHKYGILLSGGVDSRGILGCYLREKKCPTTISYGMYSKKFSDIDLSQSLANEVGGEHIPCIYRRQELLPSFQRYTQILDGMGNAQLEWSVYPRLRKDHGIEILFAGDSCFGWHDADLHNEKEMLSMLEIFSPASFQPGALPLTELAIHRLSEVSEDNMTQLSQSSELKDFHNRKDFFYLDQAIFSLTNPWRYAHSTEIEIRNPWLDNDVLDFMARVPVQYRKGKAVLYRSGKSLYRNTVRKMFPDLFKIREARVVSRPTTEDWALWKSEFRKEIEKELFDGSSAVDCLFNKDKLMSLIQEAVFLSKEKARNKNKWLKKILLNSPPYVYSIVRKFQMNLNHIRNTKNKDLPLTPPDWRETPQVGISRIMRLRRFLANMPSVF